MRIMGRTMAVVNSHLAAHTENVSRRNSDYEYIVAKAAFTPRPACTPGFGDPINRILSPSCKEFFFTVNVVVSEAEMILM
jgi:hypothetical protein